MRNASPAAPLLALLLVLLSVAGCSPSEASSGAPPDKLTLSGSSTVAPLALEMAKRFEQRHPGARVDVQTGGSSRGIADARSGLADIGMASRDLRADELDDLRAHAIARDGVGIVVNAANPLADLTDDQVRAIYRGEIARWSELGGPDAPITVVHKAAGRATLSVFLAHFDLDERAVRPDVVIGDNEQGVKTVAGDPHSIGYVSIGTAEYDALHGATIRLLPARGVAATTANVRAGTFPIVRPLNLVTRGAPRGLAREFVDFCRSPEVRDLVEDLHFAPPPFAE